jgi:hypothetical protein
VSHVETVTVIINDLDALVEAVARVGCKFVPNKKTYEWWGRSVGDYPLPEGMTVDMLGKCEHVIQLPGCGYEIGVVKTGPKKYTLAYDFYGEGGKLLAHLGPKLQRLVQMYSICKVSREAKKKGMKVQEVKHANGAVTLKIT